MPVFYDCQRCTACCRWPGQVRLEEPEIERMAEFLGMNALEFIQRHTRLRRDRRGLALEEKPGGACIFLEGTHCLVQSVKPQQCRDYPNLWQDPLRQARCQAVAREVDETTYRRLILEATGRSSVHEHDSPVL